MIIRTSQISVFEQVSRSEFVKKCRSFVKKNFPGQYGLADAGIIDGLTLRVMEFGQKYRITGELNLQKLIFIQIKYDYLAHAGLSKELKRILTFPSRRENDKVNYFHKQIIYSHAG